MGQAELLEELRQVWLILVTQGDIFASIKEIGVLLIWEWREPVVYWIIYWPSFPWNERKILAFVFILWRAGKFFPLLSSVIDSHIICSHSEQVRLRCLAFIASKRKPLLLAYAHEMGGTATVLGRSSLCFPSKSLALCWCSWSPNPTVTVPIYIQNGLGHLLLLVAAIQNTLAGCLRAELLKL